MKRRTLSLLMAVLIIFSTFPVILFMASAADPIPVDEIIGIEGVFATMNKGRTGTAKAIIIPENAANKTCKYYSNNPDLIIINENTDFFTVLKSGNAVITAISADGGKVFSTSVNVRE